jgi:hypothetical protein
MTDAQEFAAGLWRLKAVIRRPSRRDQKRILKKRAINPMHPEKLRIDRN